MKRGHKILLITIFGVLILFIIQTLPVFIIKPFGAKEIKGRNVIVYYQSGDEIGSKEVFDILENKAEEIRNKLNFTRNHPTKVFVYKKQRSLWIRKYGIVTVLGAPEWYVGDNKGDKILMISPYAKVEGNTHDSILNASIHEFVHTINYQINPKLSYWNDNAVATFLAKQSPEKGFLENGSIPTLKEMKSESERKFGNIGGYKYSYTYVEFLSKSYGWGKVLDLISGKKTYGDIFKKSEQEIYNEWVEFLKTNY